MTDSTKTTTPSVGTDGTVAGPLKEERVSPLDKYEKQLGYLNKYLNEPDSLKINPGSFPTSGDASYYSLPLDLHDSLTSVRVVFKRSEFVGPLKLVEKDSDPQRQLVIDVMMMQNQFNGLPGLRPDIADTTTKELIEHIKRKKKKFDQWEVVLLHTTTHCEHCSKVIAVGERGLVTPCNARHFCHYDCAMPSLEPENGERSRCPVCRQTLLSDTQDRERRLVFDKNSR